MGDTSSLENCVFCREAKDPAYALEFLGPRWPYESRILFELETLFAIPGYGPQVFPYVLIVSKHHIRSLSQADRILRRDIISCLDMVLQARDFQCSCLTLFEHAGCTTLSSCIEHFHLHVVSGQYDLDRDLPGAGRRIGISSRERLSGVSEPYLLVGSYDGNSVISARVEEVRERDDQFFRRCLAKCLGEEDWDWRLGMNHELMVRMMAAVRGGSSAD